MRTARNYWQETCSVLAILVGLVLTGMSWADREWPDNTGPTETSYTCNHVVSRWDCTGNFYDVTTCVVKGSPGNPGANISLYQCGDTTWSYLQAAQIRLYGKCNANSGSCTQWAEYYCVLWKVYEDSLCSEEACQYWGAGPNFCDPNNPTGQ